MKGFAKFEQWTWHRFFLGELTIFTELGVSEDRVRAYIEASTVRGGSGNYDPDSLTHKVVKLKAKKVQVVSIP
jgi:hypothetical protein